MYILIQCTVHAGMISDEIYVVVNMFPCTVYYLCAQITNYIRLLYVEDGWILISFYYFDWNSVYIRRLTYTTYTLT